MVKDDILLYLELSCNIHLDIRQNRKSIFNIYTLLVFLDKYFKGVFTQPMIEDMKLIFSKVCDNVESKLSEFDEEHDHVNLLINYQPKVSISS
ncbi:transposase [Thorsellia anophelis]|uniref:transposase n=1 Tax=Thorsellia anophelis TaxID=336804 RepID=UPI003CCBC6CB